LRRGEVGQGREDDSAEKESEEDDRPRQKPDDPAVAEAQISDMILNLEEKRHDKDEDENREGTCLIAKAGE
jgi:hypothetical protein